MAYEGSGLLVTQFGAKGNGLADDSGPIQAAIDAASTSGGVVFFPPGIYTTTTTLRCRAGGVVLQGVGHASTIRPSGSFDTVVFDPGAPQHLYGNRLLDLRFDEAAKASGHTLVGRFLGQFHAQRIYGASGWNAWRMENFNNVTLEHCRFEGYRGQYYGFASGNGTEQNFNRSDVLRLMYMVCGGGTFNPGMIGLEVNGFVHTVNGWGVHFVGVGGQGLLVRNTVGGADNPSFFTFDDFECDYPGQESIRIDAGQRFFFTNTQVHGTRGEADGIYLGKNVRGVTFSGGFSTGARHSGIGIAASDVVVSGMHFYANSNPEFGGAKNQYSGIIVGGTSHDVVISACRSGQQATADYQAAGCQIDTGAEGFVVQGNDFRGNVQPMKNGAGGGSNKVVANNLV